MILRYLSIIFVGLFFTVSLMGSGLDDQLLLSPNSVTMSPQGNYSIDEKILSLYDEVQTACNAVKKNQQPDTMRIVRLLQKGADINQCDKNKKRESAFSITLKDPRLKKIGLLLIKHAKIENLMCVNHFNYGTCSWIITDEDLSWVDQLLGKKAGERADFYFWIQLARAC